MANIDEIEARMSRWDAARTDIKALIAEVRRCHARLEIDYVWRPARDGETPERDGLVREPIPYERRASEPDGIECRDATIAMLQERLAWSQAENARLRAAMPSDAENRDRDALLGRLASENVWLREALPTPEERFELGMTLDSKRPSFARVRPWLARLDAARKGGG